MAKLTQDIGGIETGFIRPLAPVKPDSSISTLLPEVAKAGIFIDKANQTSNLKGELSAVTEEAVAAHNEAEAIMEQDVAGKDATDKMQKEFNRLKRAIDVGSAASEDAMIARAQAKLKAAIDKRPGYANELRAMYANTFGLEGGIRAEMAAAQKARVDELSAMKEDYIKRGLDPTKWGTPEGSRKYVQKTALDEQSAFLDQRLKIAQAEDALGSLDVRKELPIYSSTAVNSTETYLNTELLIPMPDGRQKSIMALSPEEIISLSDVHVNQTVEQIESFKRMLTQQARTKFGGFKDLGTAEIDASLEPAFAMLDLWKSVLNKETTAKNAKASLDYAMAVSEKQLWEIPEYRLMASLGKHNIPVTDVFKFDNQLALGKIFLGKLTNPFDVTDVKGHSKHIKETQEWASSTLKSGKEGEARELASTWMNTMLRGGTKSYDLMDDTQRLALMKWAQSPNFVEVAKEAGASDNDVVLLRDKAVGYVDRIMTHMASQVNQGMGMERKATVMGAPITINKGFPKEHIEVRLGPDGFKAGWKEDTLYARNLAKNFNEVYFSRINEGLKAWANLQPELNNVIDAGNELLNSTEASILREAMQGEGSE